MTAPTLPTMDDVEFREGELVIPEGMPFDEWERLGTSLQFRQRNIQFWLGDWYNYGETHYQERAPQAVPLGYSIRTAQNCRSVSEKFPPARRRADVPFSHHAAVASLPAEEADKLLDEAAASHGEMTVQQLRAKVRHLNAVERPDPQGYTWTAGCFTCNIYDGPTIDCRNGAAVLDRGFLCLWLADHQEHDVRLTGVYS